jgi:DNA-binding SARP family transcriptional activator
MKSIPIKATAIEGEALRLTLLGRVDLWVTGNVRVLRYAKLQALLARLAMSAGTPLRRSYLAELLWPGMPEEKGLQNLRRAIFNLKTALGEAGQMITASRDAITLAPQNIWLDVAQFTTAPPNCLAPDASCQPCLATMQSKAELYGGEFMAGFKLADCPGFEDWLQVQRETLHGRALALLERLASCHEQAGALNLALPFALRQSELEPWDEAACRRVMRLYARNDQSSAAIDHFKTFRRHLKTELGVVPSEETQLLAQTIESSRLPQESLPAVKIQALRPVLLLPTERRQATVLYCELSLQQVADPEDVLMLLKPAQAHCAAIIAQHGGHIVQAYGGGLLAYFGYPKAQEDAARRAVLAALAATRDAAHGIDIRVGIHTGLIITSVDSNLPDSGGRTSKIAIQIRQLAGAGQTVISEETQRLVGGYFNCSSLESSPLRRRAHEHGAFKVLKESGARTRLDATGQLTPLVGRSAELAQLMGLWQETVQGASRVVLIQGDAGIGKSRLLHAMKERLTGTPHALREMRCFPEFSQSPFQPLIAMLEAQFGFEVGDVPELKSVKILQYLKAHYPASAATAAPLISDLLFLPAAELAPAPSADTRKTQTNAILLSFLQELASRQPTLLVLEDAHWIDPSTRELLIEFMGRKTASNILLAMTARADFCAPWPDTSVTTINLQPLTAIEIEAILGWLGSDIAYATRQRIVARADGVPLFAEEIARMATLVRLDQMVSIPDTLHDLLAARLDHVGEAKYTAQLASALGRKFDLNLLAKVFPHGAESLASTLSTLVAAGLIVEGRGAERKFKHALIHEAAYESQIKADRQAAHQRIAQVLQSDFRELVSTRPELLARHLSEAGNTRQAIDYWLKAGQIAVDRSTYLEAIENFKSALALLPQLAIDTEREPLALALQRGMETALAALKSKSPTATEQAYLFPAVDWS